MLKYQKDKIQDHKIDENIVFVKQSKFQIKGRLHCELQCISRPAKSDYFDFQFSYVDIANHLFEIAAKKWH